MSAVRSEVATIAGAIRFVLWAQALGHTPTLDEIRERWSCSRASAYRYRNALTDGLLDQLAARAPQPRTAAEELVAVMAEHRLSEAEARAFLDLRED